MLLFKRILAWSCLLFCFSVSFGQDYVEQYEVLLETYEGKALDKAVESLIVTAQRKAQPYKASKIAQNFSIKKYYQGAYDEAIKYSTINTAIHESLEVVTSEYILSLTILGKSHFFKDEFRKSIEFHQKIVNLNTDTRSVGRSYCEIGAALNELGDYYKAADYYEIGISKQAEVSDNDRLLTNCLLLAIIYEQINTSASLKAKLKVLKQALALSKNLDIPEQTYYSIYSSLASYYNNDETLDITKSRMYQRKVLDRAISNNDSIAIANSYTNLGNLYVQTKKDSALFYLEKGLAYHTDERNTARVHNIISDYYIQNQNFDKALWHTHKSLMASAGIGNTLEEVPDNALLYNARDKISILWGLSKKAAVLLKLYENQGDLNKVKLALNNLKKADHMVDVLQLESNFEKSQFHWRERASTIYSKAIFCAKILELEELGFYFSEKKKALLLTESVLANVKQLDFSKEIQVKTLALRKEILELEYQVAEKSNKPVAESLRKSLLSKKLEYQHYSDSIQSLYPTHSENLSRTTLFSLHEVQEQLDEHTLIVSFNWENTENKLLDKVSAVFVSKDDIEIIGLGSTENVSKLVANYTESISKPFEKKLDHVHYENAANQLFTTLFPNEKIRKKLKGNRLIVVPDGPLQNTSFEALITSENKGDYLLKSTEISYAYSISFLLHNASIVRNPNREFIGFSPVTFADKTLDSLPNTVSEVATIRSIMNGETYLRNAATKKAFLDESRQYRIIHLATHADASNNPWIAFNDSILKLHELYTFKNQAELVVLSACNTSLGIVAEGEGVLSLARGIFHSGANSVVSTLWNVNDKSSAVVLTDFYENLSEGQTKSHALRNAKLNYIESHSLSDTSPYYWASFILIGDGDEIISTSNHSTILALSLILVLLIVGAIFLRK